MGAYVLSVPSLAGPIETQLREVDKRARATSWPWQRAKRRAELREKLVELEDSGEWLAIPYLLDVVLDRDQEVSRAAARAVQRLLQDVPAANLTTFEQMFRLIDQSPFRNLRPWHELTSQQLECLSQQEFGVSLLRCASCHPRGHIRGQAVRLLAKLSNGSEVQSLLLRVNDWVPAVQDAAAQAVRLRLTPAYASYFVDQLPLIVRMRAWGRLRSPTLLDDIEGLLRSPYCAEALLACTNSPNHTTRDIAFRQLASADGGAARLSLLERALDDASHSIRTWAERFIAKAAETTFSHFATRLLNSRASMIRHHVAVRLRAAGETLPWEQLLYDSHTGLRCLAQECALELEHDPAEHYRDALSATTTVARRSAALLGLGETGFGDDERAIRADLDHDSPRVRSAALRALVALRADAKEACLASFSDPSPRVIRLARELVSNESLASPSELWRAFKRADTTLGKKSALSAILSQDFWAALPYLLRASRAPTTQVQLHALWCLQRWQMRHLRVFTTPPVRLVEEVREILVQLDIPDPQRWQHAIKR